MDDFLKQKAINFQAYLKASALKPCDELLASYKEDQLVGLVLTHLMPLYATSQLDVAVQVVVDAVGNDTPEFKAKVKRYFQCFCETLS